MIKIIISLFFASFIACKQNTNSIDKKIEKGKEIYCYVENYDGNIEDVYHYFNLEIDEKDKKR